jgi:hypothetical protein
MHMYVYMDDVHGSGGDNQVCICICMYIWTCMHVQSCLHQCLTQTQTHACEDGALEACVFGVHGAGGDIFRYVCMLIYL